MPVKVFLKEDDENPRGKLIKLEANTISFDGRRHYKLYRTTIPPSLIPDKFKAQIIAEAEAVEKLKESFEGKATESELKQLVKDFKIKHKHKSIFIIYAQIEPNLIIQSFHIDHNKSFIHDDEKSDELVQNLLNRVGLFYDKQIGIVPLESPSATIKEFSKEVAEQLKTSEEENKFYRDMITRFIRLMAYAGVNSTEYEKEELFKESVEFDNKQDELIDTIIDEDEEFYDQLEKL